MAPSVSHRTQCNPLNTVMCLYIWIRDECLCVCVSAPPVSYSPTFDDPSARHLEPPLPLSISHRVYLQYPPPSLPKRCHSHARLTADIIKAVWPPDMLLAQSRNAERHRATWALAQECPVWVIISVSVYVYL